MGIKIKTSDLKNFLNKNEIDSLKLNEKVKNPQNETLKKAVEKLSSIKTNDAIYLNEDSSKCILVFKDIFLISNNVSLRLGARKMSKYKKLWHDRVSVLVTDSILKKWNYDPTKKILIEFCYEVKGNFMDYDGRMAAIKSTLDGIIESKLIDDDSSKYLSMVLGKQQKTKDGNANLIIMLTKDDNEDSHYSEDFLRFINK